MVHTKLYEVGNEGHDAHWYRKPVMDYEREMSPELIITSSTVKYNRDSPCYKPGTICGDPYSLRECRFYRSIEGPQ